MKEFIPPRDPDVYLHPKTVLCSLSGKTCYRTKKKALKEGCRLVDNPKRELFEHGFDVYLCADCGAWHLTSRRL